MNYFNCWKKYLNKRYKLDGTAIIRAAQRHHQTFNSTALSPNKQTRQIQQQRILPVAALYQALVEVTGDQKQAYAITETLVKASFFRVQLFGIRMLNYLPDPFPIIRPVLRVMVRFSEMPNGQEIIRDDRICFAVNVRQCFIYDTLLKIGSPELTPIFCATDDWLSAAMPKVRWERTQTIGRGANLCDFKWCQK